MAAVLHAAASALEGSALAQGLRGAVWLYPLVNLGHVLGIALLFGAMTMLDLRLLGVWRTVPRDALARPAVPVAAAGFALAVATGVPMLSVKAGEYAANPWLWWKFAAIGCAGLNALLLHRSRAWRSGGAGARVAWAGAASLLCWLGAVAAGRMIAYH